MVIFNNINKHVSVYDSHIAKNQLTDPAWNYGGGAKRCGLKVKWRQNLRKVFKTTSLGPKKEVQRKLFSCLS